LTLNSILGKLIPWVQSHHMLNYAPQSLLDACLHFNKGDNLFDARSLWWLGKPTTRSSLLNQKNIRASSPTLSMFFHLLVGICPLGCSQAKVQNVTGSVISGRGYLIEASPPLRLSRGKPILAVSPANHNQTRRRTCFVGERNSVSQV
jgi:hypothetical protein